MDGGKSSTAGGGGYRGSARANRILHMLSQGKTTSIPSRKNSSLLILGGHGIEFANHSNSLVSEGYSWPPRPAVLDTLVPSPDNPSESAEVQHKLMMAPPSENNAARSQENMDANFTTRATPSSFLSRQNSSCKSVHFSAEPVQGSASLQQEEQQIRCLPASFGNPADASSLERHRNETAGLVCRPDCEGEISSSTDRTTINSSAQPEVTKVSITPSSFPALSANSAATIPATSTNTTADKESSSAPSAMLNSSLTCSPPGARQSMCFSTIDGKVTALAITPDGIYCIAAFSSGSIRLFDLTMEGNTDPEDRFGYQIGFLDSSTKSLKVELELGYGQTPGASSVCHLFIGARFGSTSVLVVDLCTLRAVHRRRGFIAVAGGGVQVFSHSDSRLRGITALHMQHCSDLNPGSTGAADLPVHRGQDRGDVEVLQTGISQARAAIGEQVGAVGSPTPMKGHEKGDQPGCGGDNGDCCYSVVYRLVTGRGQGSYHVWEVTLTAIPAVHFAQSTRGPAPAHTGDYKEGGGGEGCMNYTSSSSNESGSAVATSSEGRLSSPLSNNGHGRSRSSDRESSMIYSQKWMHLAQANVNAPTMTFAHFVSGCMLAPAWFAPFTTSNGKPAAPDRTFSVWQYGSAGTTNSIAAAVHTAAAPAPAPADIGRIKSNPLVKEQQGLTSSVKEQCNFTEANGLLPDSSFELLVCGLNKNMRSAVFKKDSLASLTAPAAATTMAVSSASNVADKDCAQPSSTTDTTRTTAVPAPSPPHWSASKPVTLQHSTDTFAASADGSIWFSGTYELVISFYTPDCFPPSPSVAASVSPGKVTTRIHFSLTDFVTGSITSNSGNTSDSSGGKTAQKASRHLRLISDVSCTPDGAYALVTCSDNSVLLYSVCDVSGVGSFPTRIDGPNAYLSARPGAGGAVPGAGPTTTATANSGGGFLTFLFETAESVGLRMGIAYAEKAFGSSVAHSSLTGSSSSSGASSFCGCRLSQSTAQWKQAALHPCKGSSAFAAALELLPGADGGTNDGGSGGNCSGGVGGVGEGLVHCDMPHLSPDQVVLTTCWWLVENPSQGGVIKVARLAHPATVDKHTSRSCAHVGTQTNSKPSARSEAWGCLALEQLLPRNIATSWLCAQQQQQQQPKEQPSAPSSQQRRQQCDTAFIAEGVTSASASVPALSQESFHSHTRISQLSLAPSLTEDSSTSAPMSCTYRCLLCGDTSDVHWRPEDIFAEERVFEIAAPISSDDICSKNAAAPVVAEDDRSRGIKTFAAQDIVDVTPACEMFNTDDECSNLSAAGSGGGGGGDGGRVSRSKGGGGSRSSSKRSGGGVVGSKRKSSAQAAVGQSLRHAASLAECASAATEAVDDYWDALKQSMAHIIRPIYPANPANQGKALTDAAAAVSEPKPQHSIGTSSSSELLLDIKPVTATGTDIDNINVDGNECDEYDEGDVSDPSTKRLKISSSSLPAEQAGDIAACDTESDNVQNELHRLRYENKRLLLEMSTTMRKADRRFELELSARREWKVQKELYQERINQLQNELVQQQRKMEQQLRHFQVLHYVLHNADQSIATWLDSQNPACGQVEQRSQRGFNEAQLANIMPTSSSSSSSAFPTSQSHPSPESPQVIHIDCCEQQDETATSGSQPPQLSQQQLEHRVVSAPSTAIAIGKALTAHQPSSNEDGWNSTSCNSSSSVADGEIPGQAIAVSQMDSSVMASPSTDLLRRLQRNIIQHVRDSGTTVNPFGGNRDHRIDSSSSHVASGTNGASTGSGGHGDVGGAECWQDLSQAIKPFFCIVCQERHADCVLQPCGHVCLCSKQARTMKHDLNKLNSCPLCMADCEGFLQLTGIQRVFM